MEKSNKRIHTVKASEIYMRDPYVFADQDRSLYFLYGTTETTDGAANIDPFFEVYVSKDLINFEGPYAAFVPAKGFWGVKHYWAPEVHSYQGRYFMFASFKGGIGEDRGTGILVSEQPEGPYAVHSDGHATLKGHECLDGTLYVEDGNPYIVYCHEWTELFYGRIEALPLKADLSGTLTQEPLIIVDTKSDPLPWIRKMVDSRVDKDGYLTDAPFFYRNSRNELLMLWSSYSIKHYREKGEGGYVVALVRSQSGTLAGPWIHEKELLLDRGIGHVSLFTSFSGELMLVGHANDELHGSEYPVFLKVEEQDGLLRIKEECNE